ncbi:MAG: galactosyltransferase [Bacteroidetes bacterium]|nr:MAG: galactosyltransferase [Bacteroidota bacterium]
MSGPKGYSHRICLAIHGLIPGGMEKVMAQLAWQFSAKEGVDLHMLLYGREREIFYQLPESVHIHQPGFPFDNKWRLLNTIRTAAFIRKTVRRIRPTALLSFGEYWNSFVLLSLAGTAVPVFVSDRSSPNRKMGSWQSWLRKMLYPRAKGLVAQTNYARRVAEESRRNSHIRVIGNPIQLHQPSAFVERQNTVLTVARMVRTKHLDRLIDLFMRVRHRDWKLVIVGNDAQNQGVMAELRQQVKLLNAEDWIEFAGYSKHPEDYYLRSKVFAFTSSSEGFPNVIGEALSAGLPVVAYDCVAGPSEMIRDGENGFLIPLFDDELFAERLRQLMNDDKLREEMACLAASSVSQFSSAAIAEQYYSFITGGQG